MKRLLVLAMALSLLTSCSSIRMRYESRVETDDGRVGHYEFEKSYDVGSYPVLCGLTAIFFGGACWFYLVMPTTSQNVEVHDDALEKLAQLMGERDYSLSKSRIRQTGWSDHLENSRLDLPEAGKAGGAK